MAIAIDCVDLATAHAVECAAIEHEKLLAVEAAKARNPRFVHAKAYDDLPRDVLDAVNAFNAASGKHAVAIERKSFAEAKQRSLTSKFWALCRGQSDRNKI